MKAAVPPTGTRAGSGPARVTPAGSTGTPRSSGAVPPLVTVKETGTAAPPRAIVPRGTGVDWALEIGRPPEATAIAGTPTHTVKLSSARSPERSVPVTVIVALPGAVPAKSCSRPASSTRTSTTPGAELTAATPKAVSAPVTTAAERTSRSRWPRLSQVRPARSLTGSVPKGLDGLPPRASTRGSAAASARIAAPSPTTRPKTA